MVQGSGGGVSGFFKRTWHTIVVMTIGGKWQAKEMFSKNRKLDLSNLSYRKGDVCVLTGGGRGIGLETLKILLKCEIHVIIGCRKVSDGQKAVDLIRSLDIMGGSVEILPLDLMSLNSVREFGKSILAKQSRVHLLINNSGIMFAPYKLSEDGYESQFQVNYLGHFLLTNLLLPLLISSGAPGKFSRIVNISSCAHFGGCIDFDNLNGEKLYSDKMAYMNSKLMQVVSTIEMNGKLEKANVPVRVYSLHPGVVNTDLYQHHILQYLPLAKRLFFLTPEQGAQTGAYAALSPELENNGGIFLANSQKVRPSPRATDIRVQKKLLAVSCELCGIPEFDFSGRGTKKNEQKHKDPFVVKMS